MNDTADAGLRLRSSLRRAALAPWWFAQLLTREKSFEKNPIIASRWLNERGLHTTRVVLAHRVAAARRRRLAALVSREDRESFERDGFVLRPNFLPTSAFEALLREVRAYRCDAQEMQQGDTVTRKIALTPQTLAALPKVRDVVDSPVWRGLLRYVAAADREPILYLQSILTHAYDAPPDPQTFLHADTFHPAMKAWLFLTDVAEGVPPFTYVPGSHRLTPARLAWEKRMSLEAAASPEEHTRQGSFRVAPEDLAQLGLPQPRAFVVPANTLVVADTFGFHARGSSDRPSLRVEIWAYGRRSPFLSVRAPRRRAAAIGGAYRVNHGASAFDLPAGGPGFP